MTLVVGVDATSLPSGAVPTGTWRVVEQLTLRLAEARPDAKVVAICSDPSVLGAGRDIETRSAPGELDVFFRPHQVLRHQQLSRLFAGRWRVVLNQLDTIAVDYPEYYPSERHFQLMRNIQRASIRHADMVTTISHAAAAEIVRFCPDVEPRRLMVVSCGADHPAPMESTRPKGLPQGPFLFVVGSAFRHKNRPHAIAVVAELHERGYQGSLVMAGPEPIFGSSLAEEDAVLARTPQLSSRVVRLGPISEAEKWWLLEHADAVLYPSRIEGFGLVPFEAAAVGTPCLAAAVSSIPEVCGPNVQLARSFDAVEWADILSRWIQDPAAGRRQVNALLTRRTELTWIDAAQATWSAIDAAKGLPAKRFFDAEGPRSTHVTDARVGLTKRGALLNEVFRASAFTRRRLRSATKGERLGAGYRP